MKQVCGWWMPDHEAHLGPWMEAPKNKLILNGRQAYQGKKQLAAMKYGPTDRRRVAVDVGGHVGLWSYNLLHWFDEVHAFEPVAAHRECFLRNVGDSVSSPDALVLHAAALGKEHGNVRIETEHGSSGNSYVGGAGDILMVPLDGMGLIDVDFMKLDCEGFEENVLRGATDTIGRCKPVIIVEQKRNFSSTRFGLKDQGAVDFLKTLDYKVAEEISGDFIMVPK